jgi:dTDP-glucose 4,6-dehydratase
MSGSGLLLLGGTGFFGKSFLDAFARGLLAPWGIDRVTVLARHTAVLKARWPELVTARVTLMDADVASAPTLPTAEYVIHAAASSDARQYIEASERERANILAAVRHYAELARQVHRDSRLVYASSGAVYGAQAPEVPALDESMDLSAAGGLVEYKRAYAEAKRAAEAVIAELGQTGVRVSIARCFAFVGLYLPRDQHFAVGNFLEDGLRQRPVVVHATHPVYRSYMHADDLVRWLMTLATHASVAAPIYNVGSPEAVSVVGLARAVADRFGVEVRIPPPQSERIDRYVPSIEKAHRELGLGLRYNLASALDEIIGRLRAGHGAVAAAGRSE